MWPSDNFFVDSRLLAELAHIVRDEFLITLHNYYLDMNDEVWDRTGTTVPKLKSVVAQ